MSVAALLTCEYTQSVNSFLMSLMLKNIVYIPNNIFRYASIFFAFAAVLGIVVEYFHLNKFSKNLKGS